MPGVHLNENYMSEQNSRFEVYPGLVSFTTYSIAYESPNPLGALLAAYPDEVVYNDSESYESVATKSIPGWKDKEVVFLTSPGVDWHDDFDYFPWSALLVIENEGLVVSSRAIHGSPSSKARIPAAGDLIILNIHMPHRVKPAGNRRYNTHKRITAFSLGFETRPNLEDICYKLDGLKPSLTEIGISCLLNKKPR